MIEQAAFEIVGKSGRWRWQLRDGETLLAMAAETYETPSEARKQVAKTRVAASTRSDTSLYDCKTEIDGPVDFELVDTDGYCLWQLTAGTELLAVPPATYESKAAALTAVDRIKQLTLGAVPVHYKGADESTDRSPFVLERSELKKAAATLLDRGRRHRDFLAQLDTRIVVMGTRGKSSTTRRIGDVFHRRGYDTLVKITGNRPHMIHNGDHIPIERIGPRVTLYENIKTFWRYIPELDTYSPDGIGVFENQGLTEYTTRIFNETFVDPDVIVLTNVRQDHQDSLGQTRRDIARSFARSVPAGTHVISGEQHPLLAEYLEAEVERVGGTLTQVSVPDKHALFIGAETVHAINEVLAYLSKPLLPESELEGYLRVMQPEWTRLSGGTRLFNAAEVNDIESTEAVRRSLAGDEEIVPFVYLRGDRRGRTASFASYINTLVDRGLVSRVFAGGDYTSVFASTVNAPVETYPPDADPSAVLDDLVSTDLPIVLMGNTVAAFMRRFETVIERRATRATHEESAVISDTRQVPLSTFAREMVEDSPEPTPVDAPMVSTTAELQQLLADRNVPPQQQAQIVEALDLPAADATAESGPERRDSPPDGRAGTDLSGIEADLDRLQTHVDSLTDTFSETAHQQTELEAKLDGIKQELETVSENADRLDRLQEATTRNTARIDESDRRVEHLSRDIATRIQELETEVSDTRSRISQLQQLEGQRLQREIQQDVTQIEDLDTLQKMLSEMDNPEN
jgi:uncharacterized protein YegP (UPF0339 family)